jgi:ABC-2 type transport system ATP-binding protein
MTNAIEVDNLGKSYVKRGQAPVRAVSGLNLKVPAGQVIGFLGPNGAGKTTTIKMMCGLVRPTTGQITLNGIDVAQQRGQAMQQIGAVLEGTRNVYWRLTALQNLLYFGRLKGCWGKALKGRAEQLLRELDLWERRNDPVKEFSRGMQQKVAIACALVADPPIVLLDEPTLGLDVHAARTVKTWVKELSSTGRKTVVLTTHQLDLAEELCQRVVIIHQGEIVADQPTEALLNLFRKEYYEIRLDGHLETAPRQGSPMLDSWSIAYKNGHTLLTGAVEEAPALYPLLTTLGQTGLPLLSVNRATPNLEEVFIQLTQNNPEERTP